MISGILDAISPAHHPPKILAECTSLCRTKVMAQFVLKIEKLFHIMGPALILEMARAYGLRPRLWLLLLSHIFSKPVNANSGVPSFCEV